MIRRSFLAVAVVSVITGCSTTPRPHVPIIAGIDASTADRQQVIADCETMVAGGVRRDFRGSRLAGVGVGAAAGYGTGAMVMVTAGETLVGSAAAASATLVAMPLVGIVAGVGYSRIVRARREREVREAMELCLQEHGYQVESWTRAN